MTIDDNGIIKLEPENSSTNQMFEFESFPTKYGIDVSYFQNNINWSQVRADGQDFAIIRAGYRGYGTG